MNSKISALMDGELFEDEAEALLDELQHAPETRRDWMVYHLIGDVLRQPEFIHRDLSARMAEAMSTEPAIFAPRTRAMKQRTRVFALSAAASVLAVGVVVWMSAQVESNYNTTPVAQLQPAVRPASLKSTPQVNDYLMAHQENSPRADFNGATAVHRIHEGQDGSCR